MAADPASGENSESQLPTQYHGGCDAVSADQCEHLDSRLEPGQRRAGQPDERRADECRRDRHSSSPALPVPVVRPVPVTPHASGGPSPAQTDVAGRPAPAAIRLARGDVRRARRRARRAAGRARRRPRLLRGARCSAEAPAADDGRPPAARTIAGRPGTSGRDSSGWPRVAVIPPALSPAAGAGCARFRRGDRVAGATAAGGRGGAAREGAGAAQAGTPSKAAPKRRARRRARIRRYHPARRAGPELQALLPLPAPVRLRIRRCRSTSPGRAEACGC